MSIFVCLHVTGNIMKWS